MSGNVREWVYDFYSPTAYKEASEKSPAVNPKGPKTGKVHVARGGDYSSSIEELRCAARAFEEEWWRSGDPQIPKSEWWLPEMDFIGFRVARPVDMPRQKSHK
jgi:formylglycine-generating enzyme required for sulfatase activity